MRADGGVSSEGACDTSTTPRKCTAVEGEVWNMSVENVVGLIVAVALVGYLVAAFVKPEKF